ncbi:UvrD-helicase domain-containing protein [Pseudomonas syringae group genomosp. 3]|uniref:UvrD-helicase domain-containing protein n=1 Tax=Pseudomonas syringae group genomosp. 3 TaxID=251701 RepID=UPI000F001D55|nr:ATP-dependent helicase [Pseudomonas syringae group genomosp. 3]RMR31660.1 UvrD/REP helicase [Pseudomonas syringae pv. coriandricola]
MTFPTEEQKAYMDVSLKENVYLKACPGSGKTEVIAAMVSQAILRWARFPAGLAVLTFSNSATDELSRRLSRHLGESVTYPHCVSTFDSFLLSQIVAGVASVVTDFPGREGDFRIRVVDNTSNLFLTSIKVSGQRISACRYDYDLKSKSFVFDTGELTLDKQLNKVEKTKALVEDLVKTKKRLWKAGFATHSDVGMIAIKAFSNKALTDYFKRLARRYPVIFVDECQDLSFAQLRIIKSLHQLGMRFHFVGDLNQSIYGFRRSEPALVKQFIEELAFKSFNLTANWRSGQGVVDLCSNLLKLDRLSGNPAIETIRPKLIQYAKCPSEIVPTVLELTRPYTHVVVVARGHSTLQRFSGGRALKPLEELAVACIQFRSEDLSEVRHAMETFAAWLAAKLETQVKTSAMSCPHDVELSLTWRLFVSNCLTYLATCGSANLDLTWKSWSSLTKRTIRSIPDQSFVPDELAGKLESLREVHISSPVGLGKATLQSRLVHQHQYTGTRLQFATIHQVKGETHEATVVVSSLQSGPNQSNWKDWLADSASEAARFAYVASSRPSHLLIWAVKKLKEDESKTLSGLGFEIL